MITCQGDLPPAWAPCPPLCGDWATLGDIGMKFDGPLDVDPANDRWRALAT